MRRNASHRTGFARAVVRRLPAMGFPEKADKADDSYSASNTAAVLAEGRRRHDLLCPPRARVISGKPVMSHVLLVEPDDDFCLFLRQAVCDAGQRATITGSLAEASDALCGTDAVDLVIGNAALPDGSGLVLAGEAMRLGKPCLLVRMRRERVEVSDGQAAVFRGARLDFGEFLKTGVPNLIPNKSPAQGEKV